MVTVVMLTVQPVLRLQLVALGLKVEVELVMGGMGSTTMAATAKAPKTPISVLIMALMALANTERALKDPIMMNLVSSSHILRHIPKARTPLQGMSATAMAAICPRALPETAVYLMDHSMQECALQISQIWTSPR
jgi:hypothetical protein